MPAAEVDAGAPTTALAELGSFAGLDYGIWEMTTGTARDVEADELFVVLAGRGTVEFLDAADVAASADVGAVPRILSLEPGSLVRLHAGERTRWTITEPLRKVWLAPGE
ncbi:cupin domain-containing protein [Schumannella sp. 10F1B-5-1]|nr:cupin domain-containing protein [Schumannella sp. 10F1B-5-1]